MSNTVIKVENLSKQYRLGTVGTGTLGHDLNRWWQTSILKKEDPYLKIGDVNDRAVKGDSEYVWALQDINFEVKQGEVLGIIGRNGAGKSTLLKILSRTTSPTTGSVKIKGRVASLLEVGTGFHGELTGRENIFLNGAILGMTKTEIKRKLDEIIDFSGVEKYIDTPVKRYSSGMYVRLAFAVAAHLEPEILIVDEVLAVGDAEFQKKALGKMKDVSNQDGRTILFVSHNMAAIQNLCDKGLVLNNGMTTFLGPIEDALNLYRGGTIKLNVDSNLLKLPREGNGKLKFKKVKFIDRNNNEVVSPICGDLVKIILEAEVYEKLKNVAVAISFYSLGGECKLTLWSELTDTNFNINEGDNQFSCVIDKFPLSRGIYSANLYSTSNPDLLDWVQDAFSFEMEDGDFYRTGRAIQSDHQTVLIQHVWVHE